MSKQKNLIAVLTMLFLFLEVSCSFARNLTIDMTGFIDINYLIDENADRTAFLLDQVELDIKKRINGIGSLRTDINFIHRDSGFPTSMADNTDNNNNNLSSEDILEQGFITLENNSPITLKIGKFNAPIGFERLDPTEMYQHSHSMIFDYGLPKNLTGVNLIANYAILKLNLYYVNGWDSISDENNNKTIGGRLGILSRDGNNLGISYITGKEKSRVGWEGLEELSVFDIDYSFSPTKNFILGGEYNKGIHKKNSPFNTGIEDATWSGYLLMLHYDFSNNFGLTIRYDVFDDNEGARLKRDAVDKGKIPQTGESRKSFTYAVTFNFIDGFGGLAEYKSTKSNKDVFVDKKGRVINDESTIVVEFIYLF